MHTCIAIFFMSIKFDMLNHDGFRISGGCRGVAQCFKTSSQFDELSWLSDKQLILVTKLEALNFLKSPTVQPLNESHHRDETLDFLEGCLPRAWICTDEQH